MNTVPHTIAIFGNTYQTEKSQFIEDVIYALTQLGAELVIEKRFSEFLRSKYAQVKNEFLNFPCFDAPDCRADLAISMGGDGTFLNTVEKLRHRTIPILGVNTGRLGFLADVTPSDIADAMQRVMEGQFAVVERTQIEVLVDGRELGIYPFALNEVALLKHDNSSVIEVNTLVDGHLLTNYLADGLIISTPTGSTGYSLSAGGPVLDPQSATFCLSPVAPHSLTMRPVILRDEVVIDLSVKSRSGSFLIAIDGRSQSLPEGAKIRLRKADYKVPIVKMHVQDFFYTLREKMMWGKDQRQ